MNERLRTAVRIALVLLGLWLAVGVVLGVLAVRDVQRGIDAAEQARANIDPSSLVEGTAAGDLERARAAFAAGHRKASGPGMAVLRMLPLVGRNVRSVAALSNAAAVVADVGTQAVSDAGAVLDEPQSTGPDRVRAATSISAIAGRAAEDLDDLDLGPKNLLPPLAERRSQFADQLDEVRTTLARARDAGQAVGALLGGPRTYLLLAANNAEMRAGSGMFLSVGTLRVADGEFELGELVPAGELYLDSDTPPPPLTGDLEERWGWLDPNQEWRNLGVSPRFDATAELAAAMWEAHSGEAVDGVLMVDAEALRGVIAATGPVPLDDQVIDAGSVIDFVLHDQYDEYGDSLDPESQAPRREQLGRIASAAITAIESGEFEVATLARELSDAVAGRHLMAWSARPEEQRGWEAAGVAGALTENDALLAIINRGGNKLDWFLDVAAEVEVDPGMEGTAVTITVDITNETPEGEVRYVAGPYPGSGVGEGVYTGLVTMNLPGTAADLRLEGVDQLAVAGADGPTVVVGGPLTLGRGESRRVVVSFSLPQGLTAFRILPSARIPPVSWKGPDGPWAENAHSVAW